MTLAQEVVLALETALGKCQGMNGERGPHVKGCEVESPDGPIQTR